MSSDLKLRVVFDMVDRLTAPLRQALAGSKGLSKEIGNLKKQLSDLQKQQKTVDSVKALRTEMGATATKLKTARAEVEKWRGQIQATDSPTTQMQNKLRRASAAVVSLSSQYAKQRDRLGELNTRMQGAGRGTQTLIDYERFLQSSIAQTNDALTEQGRRLQAVHGRRAALAPARERMQQSQALASNLAIGGYAARATGGRVLGALGGTIGEAQQAQTEEARIRALGFGNDVSSRAIAFSRRQNIYGTSTNDNLMLTRDALSVFGDEHHAEMAAPVLAKMKFANEAVYGAEHGGQNEQQFMNMLKAIELRGGTKDEATFNDEANRVQRVISATGGRVSGDQWMEFIKRGGVAAKSLSKDAFYYQMEPLIQEMGGDTAGNALMSGYQNLIEGRTTVRASRKLMNFGLLDSKKVEHDKNGHVKAFGDGALLNAEQFKNSPFEWMQKTLIPLLNKRGITSDKAIVSTIGSMFTNRAASNLFSTMYLQRAVIEKNERNNRNAADIDQLNTLGKESGAGKALEMLAQSKKLKQEIGEQILPLYNKGLEIAAGLMSRLTGFIKEHTTTAKTLLVTLAALGVVLGVGGTLMIGLAAIIGPLAVVRFGMSALGVSARSAEGGLGIGARALSGWSSAAKTASTAGGAAGRAASRLRTALSATWTASSPRDFARSVSRGIPQALRTARDATRRWGMESVATMKRSAGAARDYVAELGRVAAAKSRALTARVASAGRYVARRGARGVAADALSGGFGMLKGGARGAITGITDALGGLARTFLFVGRLALTNPIGLVITGIAVAALLIVKYWEPIKAFFAGFWQGLREGLAPLSGMFGEIAAALGEVFAPLKPVWDWLVGAIRDAWGWLMKLFGPIQTSQDSLDKATSSGKQFGLWLAGLVVSLADVIKQFEGFGANLMQGLVNGITNGLSAVKEAINNVANSTVAWFKEKLGIHSPSRVFDALGGFIGQGAAQGIDGERVRVAKSAASLAGAASLTFGALTGSGVAGAAEYRPLVDQRAPLTAAARPQSDAGGSVTNHYHITLNGISGTPEDIEAAIRRAMDAIERDKRRRSGSSLSDRE
ncbi:MAG: hypothetical protein VB141_10605 [Burkholderia gladioli]